MKILRLSLWLLVGAAAAALAIANRGPVTIDLWPLPYSLDIPKFALIFVTLLIGGVIGAASSWLSRTRRPKVIEADPPESDQPPTTV